MLLKNLSECNGTSGAEKEVRDVLCEEIKSWVTSVSIDKIGNLIAYAY